MSNVKFERVVERVIKYDIEGCYCVLTVACVCKPGDGCR